MRLSLLLSIILLPYARIRPPQTPTSILAPVPSQPAPSNFINPTLAFEAAQSTHRNVLLLFAGSDWCIPCIHFEKKILADSVFQNFAANRLVLLIADFPQRKKMPDSLRIQYEALAGEFNPNGVFPQIVVLDPSKKLLATLPYTEQSVQQFIRELRNLCRACPP
jgi:thiol:disulfide interchange protein